MIKDYIKNNSHMRLIYIFLINKLIGRNKWYCDKINTNFCNCIIKKTVFEAHGKNNFIEIGDYSYISNCRIRIYGSNNRIKIGKNVILNGVIFHIEDDGNSIILGDSTTAENNTKFACIEGRDIVVAEDCMFSSDVSIVTGDSHSVVDAKNNRINPSKNVDIGSHVWIGNRVSINKGVNIAANSIIGNGAIVTKEITNENVVIAGNPAKIVKENVNWKRERI